MLQAGYLEEWRYNVTLSGAPQGGIISPILSNIYLDKFDKYIEQVLMPAYTKGDERKDNTPYYRLISLAYVWRKKGKRKEANALRKQAQQLPTFDPNDPDYRRLKYVRYADDWCIGYIGTKAEALEIKNQIKEFLQRELGLTLSEEKTLITHAKTEAARFLGYYISIMQDNTYRTTRRKKRNANGKVKLSVPPDVLKQKCQRYQRHGKPIHRPELTNNTVYSIVAQYQSEYRGVVEYYQLANDIYKFNRLKWVMETSLTKTLAAKLRLFVEFGAG
ncbi:reverse transcriptase domain-containing protein [Ktedonobacter racemifer]|uniref:reverse transcriptase domain-containing protein n=1 Tax=Ktedonobacter racemifer TaxID=363277 RepID=UPI000948E320